MNKPAYEGKTDTLSAPVALPKPLPVYTKHFTNRDKRAIWAAKHSPKLSAESGSSTQSYNLGAVFVF